MKDMEPNGEDKSIIVTCYNKIRGRSQDKLFLNSLLPIFTMRSSDVKLGWRSNRVTMRRCLLLFSGFTNVAVKTGAADALTNLWRGSGGREALKRGGVRKTTCGHCAQP